MSDDGRCRPRSLGELFLSFTGLALQGFGGVMVVVQRELVERRRWFSPAEFVEEWAVAQVLPGPNVVNLSIMIGARHFGWRGALAALGGLFVCPLVLLLGLALVYTHFSDHPQFIGALRGMGAVAAGLILATGLKLFAALRGNPLGIVGCGAFAAISFAGMVWLHWPLALVLAGPGLVACLLVYGRLAR